MKHFELGNITFSSELDRDRELLVETTDRDIFDTHEYLEEKEAIELIKHLITVFGLGYSELGDML